MIHSTTPRDSTTPFVIVARTMTIKLVWYSTESNNIIIYNHVFNHSHVGFLNYVGNVICTESHDMRRQKLTYFFKV